MTFVSSPCISVCQMDLPTGLCVGCWRTLDEITVWSTLADTDKNQVWEQIELRRKKVVFQSETKALETK